MGLWEANEKAKVLEITKRNGNKEGRGEVM